MSIDGVNVGQPAFKAKSKDGNDYDKTNAGKAVGGVLGGLAVAKGLSKTAITSKMMADDKFVKGVCDQVTETLLADGKGAMTISKEFNVADMKSFKNALKQLKGATVVAGIIGSVIAGATLFGAGALIDKIINNNKAKQADKPVYLK